MQKLYPILVVFLTLTLTGFTQHDDSYTDNNHETHKEILVQAAFDGELPSGDFFRTAPLVDYINSVQVKHDIFDEQSHCLAQAIYFEARGEPIEGQLAVAQVVMNRVQDHRYPNTVCDVVFQNERMRHRCQFSFACDGKSDRARNTVAWSIASKISTIVMTSSWHDITNEATHYHADYVDPYWSKKMEKTVVYGQHLFYINRSPNP